jgi:DNA-binding transcriptional regulator YiaG
VKLSGMSASVERELFRCDRCGDEQRTVEQRETAETKALESIRETNALLTPREIRQLRERIGLTAEQLGALLYGTPRGVVEGWERGRYLQNRETDALLRSFNDREVVQARAAKCGVVLRTPEELERERAERAASLAAARQRGKDESVAEVTEREVRATPANGSDVPADRSAPAVPDDEREERGGAGSSIDAGVSTSGP